jgi:hypothetical protein
MGLLRHARVEMTIGAEDYPSTRLAPIGAKKWNRIHIPCVVEHLVLDINLHDDMWTYLGQHPWVQGLASVVLHNTSLSCVPAQLCASLPVKLAPFRHITSIEAQCWGTDVSSWISNCPLLCPPTVTALTVRDQRTLQHAVAGSQTCPTFVPGLRHLTITADYFYGNIWDDIVLSGLSNLETLSVDLVQFENPDKNTPLLREQLQSMPLLHTITVGEIYYDAWDGDTVFDTFAYSVALTHLHILVGGTYPFPSASQLVRILTGKRNLRVTILFQDSCPRSTQDYIRHVWQDEPRVTCRNM